MALDILTCFPLMRTIHIAIRSAASFGQIASLTFVFCHPDRSGILLPRSGGINAKRFAFAFREGNRCERRTLKGVCDVRIQQ